MEWAATYREHPAPYRLPEAVHAMQRFGLLGDTEKRGFCTGFIAGVLGTNPKDGPGLVAGMFPMPGKEQAVIIKAIAYSGRPDWEDVLIRYRSKMPLREPMIADYLNGKEPLLMQADLDQDTELIYTLWGYYAATGQYQPVMRIIDALRWAKAKDEPGFSWSKLTAGWTRDPKGVDKATIGGTAKWTLASYGERNRNLIALYRSELPRQPKEIAAPLRDVIEAAELFKSEDVREDQLTAIQEAQKQQVVEANGMSKLETAGSIGIATGCVAATALGQAQVTVPCVIGGALYSGAVKLLH
ncbi:hypothetical protein V6C03_06240 [Methyloligella sp. 2.7D]|uniref:hypothetical protein n=1 Tax=unclassified Methyloligella TaxID=2625955 RepID=UPI001ABA6D9B|nr:hypothetical protein [Methyloligella sp. GL2]